MNLVQSDTILREIFHLTSQIIHLHYMSSPYRYVADNPVIIFASSKPLWSKKTDIQYIPRNMHTVFALLCFVVVIHWLIFPYPSGLLHWHCGNLTIAPVPAKQPWWIWINTSCEFIMNDCITTTKQSTTKPCAYFLGYTVCIDFNSTYDASKASHVHNLHNCGRYIVCFISLHSTRAAQPIMVSTSVCYWLFCYINDSKWLHIIYQYSSLSSALHRPGNKPLAPPIM